MSSLKQRFSALLLLSIIIVPAFLHSSTILDAQEQIKTSLEHNWCISPEIVKATIREMIDVNRMKDVDALEKMLLQFKKEVAQKQLCFLNQNRLNFLRKTIISVGIVPTTALTVLGSGSLICAPIIVFVEDLLKEISDPEHWATQDHTKMWKLSRNFIIVGLGVGVVGSEVLVILYKIKEKIDQLKERYRILEMNKQIIDELLAYLYLHKGITIGQADC